MKCEILASVMDQKDMKKMLGVFNVGQGQRCTIINQLVDDDINAEDIDDGAHRFFSFREKGLSRSRNHAVRKAHSDICLICDDDCHYVENYEELIVSAYRKHPEADIITFDFTYEDVNKYRKTMRGGKVGFMRALKVSSTQITFKRQSIVDCGIKFDERFGTGSEKYHFGEENIFLFDCLKAGLKIVHVPVIIIVKSDYGTTWDRSNSPENFEQRGAVFYRLTSHFWWALALQFTVRKHKKYKNDMGWLVALRSMVKGARTYRKEFC